MLCRMMDRPTLTTLLVMLILPTGAGCSDERSPAAPPGQVLSSQAGAPSGSPAEAAVAANNPATAGAACAKSAACAAGVCNIDGLDGTDVLNALSCPQACCTASGACGLALAATSEAAAVDATECLALAQAGTVSDSCPNYFDAFEVGGENLFPFERENLAENNFEGCCRPDGACGFMVSAYGLGCVSVHDMPKFTAVIAFIGALAPRVCVPVDR
jgi:hypothetical protein